MPNGQWPELGGARRRAGDRTQDGTADTADQRAVMTDSREPACKCAQSLRSFLWFYNRVRAYPVPGGAGARRLRGAGRIRPTVWPY
jgi:hypothetical protein